MSTSLTLDPQNWHALEDAFHQALNAGLEHLQSLEEQPVWRPAPEAVKSAFRMPLPQSPKPLEQLLEQFRDQLLPYGNGNTHPRFFGWVHGGGNLYGALGELCAALLNNNLGGRDHIAHHVEHQVLQWSREMFGFPTSSSGLLTSGTSMATLIALAVARQSAVGASMKTQGLQGNTSPLVGYCSAQSHNSVLKAFQLLGLGGNALRAVPVSDDFTLDTQALAELITADRLAGATPFCVIATVGTVNTGAIDDIAAIRKICQREELWLHVDAAFGGALALLDEYQDTLDAVRDADSIAFDFHKWFQVPYAVGGLLVKDANTHRATFSERKEYLTTEPVGLSAGAPWFCDFGPELSRGFMALKVWFTFQGIGTERLAGIVRKHCQLATETANAIDASANLERLAPVPMNVVCCRYVPPHLQDETSQHASYLDALNNAIVTQLQLQGRAAPSTTVLHGCVAIRVAIVNHRTESAHMNDLVSDIQQLGTHIDQRFALLLQPAQWHLMQGGDARLVVDPDTGLNRYGCSPSPRDHAFTFASSTATSISAPAYQAAEQYRQRLLHDCVKADSLAAPLAQHCRSLESELATTLGLADLNPDLHLSPSGTDSQLHVVAAVTTAIPSKWVSIVCGSDETGSGTPFSVTGCHFDNTTCLGHTVTKGERLSGMAPIAYKGVPFRNTYGRLQTIEEMDSAVEDHVRDALDQGYNVMLHAMDQSKFGCWAPSPTRLDQLRQRYGSRLQVIIDACQLRIDQEDLREHLDKGDILLLTGSKFFTGPPFSGVAIFPQVFSHHLQQCGRSLPSGLTEYLPKPDLGSWDMLLPSATTPFTIGMYLRWRGALEEAKRYYQVPKEKRLEGLDCFSNEVLHLIGTHPHLESLFEKNSTWWARPDMLGDELSVRRSIFPFLIRHRNGQYLTQEQVRHLYEQLNSDLSAELKFEKQELAAQCCHIGQPVKVDSKNTSALRISMGARILSDGWHDGTHDSHHLEEELRQVRIVLAKLTLCISYL
ncbi:pyridoxal phosphate-dependent decarboxylase family protein [Chromohalobacter sarecensis]|uniref:Pyridoxal phosphate-dependent decarboxylase family protein n=1 Tax=Chromohalobacter sarecensis TaxID=245294 RepID=A0ABV9CWW7_9GAMM|nr:pyridoxal-dependent decarboxylase [Chromohalobacter sarecensis]MCK0715649.1 pyridoxal-dependent decarboxylase [Chromohalobacter sarecensis]